MIFVTVGSTYFDGLIEEIDKLAGSGFIKDKVVAQIGAGSYAPKNIEHFRYSPSLDEHYLEADVVITHAAAGTLFTVLGMGKRCIAVTNPRLQLYREEDVTRAFSKTKDRKIRITNRQMGLPMTLEDEGYLVWCQHAKEIGSAMKELDKRTLKPYMKPKCWIPQEIAKLFTTA